MTTPEASEPPEDDPEPSDEVPDTLPEDWTDAPAPVSEEAAGADAGTEEEQDLDALHEHITALEAKVEAAERRADELIAVSRRQADMADQLHAENQTLRDGEIAQAVAPLVRNAARIADEVAAIRDARPGDRDLEHVAKRLGELLHDAGVTVVTPVAGEAFDPRAHQAAGATPTDAPARDRCVAEVRRPGLVREDGRVLRPAEVVVFRFTPPPTDDEGAAP